jgi:capsular polysaccharide biosynthesis protein/MinD-like ATPase involved in chromosome partitioning or flagellar assembly
VISSPETNSDDLRVALQAGQTYRDIVGSQLVLEEASERLGLTASAAGELRSRVAADWNSNSQILTVRARASTPEEAADVANAVAETLIALGPEAPDSLSSAGRERTRERIAELELQEQALEAEISELSDTVQAEADIDAQRALIVALDQRRDQLADVQRDLTGLYRQDQSRIKSRLTLLDTATPPTRPIEPDVERILLTALLGGLALGAAAVLLLAYLDHSLRSPAELVRAAGARYLGGVGHERQGRLALTEHGRTIAFGLETMRSRARTLLITSPGRDKARSTVTLLIGRALAHMGRKVILVDVDLQRRQLSHRLAKMDLRAAGQITLPGASEPLTLLEAASIPGLHSVLVAEVAPHARAEAGLRLSDDWIAALRERADYLLFDGDHAAAPDTLALSRQVEGVVLVATSGATRVEHAARAAESLRTAGARLLGVVLAGLRTRSPYDYTPAAEPVGQRVPTPPRPVPAEYAGRSLGEEELLVANAVGAGHRNGSAHASS